MIECGFWVFDGTWLTWYDMGPRRRSFAKSDQVATQNAACVNLYGKSRAYNRITGQGNWVSVGSLSGENAILNIIIPVYAFA